MKCISLPDEVNYTGNRYGFFTSSDAQHRLEPILRLFKFNSSVGRHAILLRRDVNRMNAS